MYVCGFALMNPSVHGFKSVRLPVAGGTRVCEFPDTSAGTLLGSLLLAVAPSLQPQEGFFSLNDQKL